MSIINEYGYNVEEVDDFLTLEECDKIIELCDGKLKESKIYSGEGDIYDKSKRDSEQCWLEDDNIMIRKIRDKVRMYTNTVENYQEMLQVVRYKIGGFISCHYDACDGDEEYCKRLNGEYGERYITVLFYLNDDFEGGRTIFPYIKRYIKAKKGKCVIFKNVNKDGNIIRQSLHESSEVISGEKWIGTIWIKNKRM